MGAFTQLGGDFVMEESLADQGGQILTQHQKRARKGSFFVVRPWYTGEAKPD